MFIELTDHLRCPADHEEQYLVLLPEDVVARSVLAGELGCPACGRAFRIVDGILDTGDTPAEPAAPTALDGSAIAALAGLGGPGGYLVLVGGPAAQWAGVAAAAPGVSLVAVNPPAGVADAPGLSLLRGGRLALKSGSMRGVVLGRGYAEDPWWLEEAMRVTLAGLRIVGEGTAPEAADLTVLAEAGGWWVASKARNRM